MSFGTERTKTARSARDQKRDFVEGDEGIASVGKREDFPSRGKKGRGGKAAGGERVWAGGKLKGGGTRDTVERKSFGNT